METSEFAVELHKTEEKDVIEKLYVLFQTEKQSVVQKFFKIGVLKFCKFHRKNPVLESLFNKVARLEKFATLSKRDSSTDVSL